MFITYVLHYCVSDINPREIVSSIVEAANRKLRGEHAETEKRSVSISDAPPKYSERNIDQEILKRKKIETTSRSSPNLAAMQRSQELLKVSSQELSSDRRMAKSQEFCEREFSDFDFIDSDKETSSSAYLSPSTRYFSDDVLDKNDELELSHGTQNGGYSRLSRETIDSLRRIELEARAIREREERRQRDLEKRKLERQKIEQDILQTQQEIDFEDRHSVEDLLNAPEYAKFGLSAESPSKRRIENYRTSSGERSSSSSSSGRYSVRDSPNAGKYFITKGNTQSSPLYSRMSRPPRQTSVESLVIQSKRTGSLENMSEGQHSNRPGATRPMAQVRARKGDERSKRDSSEIKRKSGLIRSSSMRRGSLDSLIDMLEKRDSRMSWASTDSDEGYDLLTTLTSTFDQKLQNLSSPKAAQTTAPSIPRRMPYNSSNSSLNTNTAVSDSGDSSSHSSAQNFLPPQAPLSLVNRQNQGSLSDLPSKQFRDPSLHRTPPKPDTKIGLATRFERSSNHATLYEGHSEPSLNLLARSSSNHGVNLQSDITYSVDSAVLNNNSINRHSGMERSESDSRVASVMVVISSPSVMSADSSGGYSNPVLVSKPLTSSSSGQPKWESYVSPPPTRYTEYRPITKSEKTEVNVKLSQSFDKNKVNVSDNKTDSMTKSRSASPQPVSRKRSDKRKKRRHTVGGTSDSENMRAISEAVGKDGSRLSAWEQLRPNVGQHSNIGPNSSMLTWLRNERLRGSSPDLSITRRDKPVTKKN